VRERHAADPEPGREHGFEIWPENLPAFEIFAAVVHQQRVVAGFGASTCQGIDAAALNAALDARQVPAAGRWELFTSVLDMGRVAAQVMNEHRNG